MARELAGPGEVIEVCQECGTVIDPERVTLPDGSRCEIWLCREIHPVAWDPPPFDRDRRDWLTTYRMSQMLLGINPDPLGMIRITGV